MNSEALQNLCQIGILIFGVLTAACVYGSYFFGQQKDVQIQNTQEQRFQEAHKERRILTDELAQKIDKHNEGIINEIKSLLNRNESFDANKDLSKNAEKVFETIKFSQSKIFLRNEYSPNSGGFGTWFTPIGDIKSSKKFYLADLLGDIDRNRISLFVSDDAKIVCKILTANKGEHTIEVDISSWKSGEPHLLIVQWNVEKQYVELNIDSVSTKKNIPNLKFDRLGPLFIKGADFEGHFPAKLAEGGPSIVEGLRSIGFKEYNREEE